MKGKHHNIIPHHLLFHTKVVNFNHCYIFHSLSKWKKKIILKDFSKNTHIYNFWKTNSSNFTGNASKSSFFHKFEQQWHFEDFYFYFSLIFYINKPIKNHHGIFFQLISLKMHLNLHSFINLNNNDVLKIF